MLEAAADLAISEQAVTTIDAIATRAGVSRTTVHKWWPSAAAVALEGLLERYHAGVEADADLGVREALALHLRELVQLLGATPAGPLLRRITAAASTDASIATALREQWLAPRRAGAARVLERGIAAGELREDIDVDAVIDALFAPAYHRLSYGHAPLDVALQEQLLDIVLRGITLAPHRG